MRFLFFFKKKKSLNYLTSILYLLSKKKKKKKKQEFKTLKQVLDNTLINKPINPVNKLAPEYYYTRILSFYETEKMTFRIMWPPTNFYRFIYYNFFIDVEKKIQKKKKKLDLLEWMSVFFSQMYYLNKQTQVLKFKLF